MTAQPAHPNPCPPACHTPNPPWWCDCLDPVPIDNYWFILAGMGVALVWWHFWKRKTIKPPVIGSVNLTENQIGELSDIGRQYIYLDENDEGRLSHGGVVEIIKRYEELRAPDVVGRFINDKFN